MLEKTDDLYNAKEKSDVKDSFFNEMRETIEKYSHESENIQHKCIQTRENLDHATNYLDNIYRSSKSNLNIHANGSNYPELDLINVKFNNSKDVNRDLLFGLELFNGGDFTIKNQTFYFTNTCSIDHFLFCCHVIFKKNNFNLQNIINRNFFHLLENMSKALDSNDWNMVNKIFFINEIKFINFIKRHAICG